MLRVRWPHQRNTLAVHPRLHLLRLIQAKNAVRVINQQIKVLEKVVAKDASHLAIEPSYLLQILHQGQSILDRMRTRLQEIKLCIARRYRDSKPGHSSRAHDLQARFRYQRWIDGCHLSARIHQKVIRPLMVNLDRNYNLRTFDEAQA